MRKIGIFFAKYKTCTGVQEELSNGQSKTKLVKLYVLRKGNLIEIKISFTRQMR